MTPHTALTYSPTPTRLADAAGLDGTQVVADAQKDESKTRLREQTDAAILQGVFGVPTMRVGDELFWGYDDLSYLEHLLAGRDPFDPDELRKWMGAGRASARRRRFRETGWRGVVAETFRGGCLCGAVRFEVTDVFDAGLCHYTICRRLSGAPALFWANVPSSSFRVTQGDTVAYRSSERFERHFCPTCGTPVFGRAREIFVPAEALPMTRKAE